eukprot:5615428-Pyramimonas_sp.AAC.1
MLGAWNPNEVPWKGTWTGRPSRDLEREADRLGELWDTTYHRPRYHVPAGPHEPSLPPIKPQHLIDAAKRFSHTTASTWDGFHPKHFQ